MKPANPIAVIFFAIVLTSPDLSSQPITRPRAPAEWEEVKGVIFGWFEADFLWDHGYARDYGGWTRPMLRAYNEFKTEHAELVKALLKTGVEVYIIDDTTNTYSVPDTLIELGLISPKIHVVAFAQSYQKTRMYKSWLRDNGPFSIYQNGVGSLRLHGWKNDMGGEIIASFLSKSYHKFDMDTGYYTDGGNFIVDGYGKLFYDSRFQPDDPREREKVKRHWRDSFGLEEFIELPPYQIHLDYYLKLVNEETFFVSEILASNYLGDEKITNDNERIDAAVKKIKAQTVSRSGRPYKFVKIPNSPSYVDYGENSKYETIDATYINSLIINETVIVPTFDNPDADATALQLYEKYMPGYQVIGVPATRFAERGGGIHCATREIHAENPLFIAHERLPDSLHQTTDYEINARIQSASGISTALLYWKTDEDTAFKSVPMAKDNEGHFKASIPAQPRNTRVHYYLEATSNDGKTIPKPMVAPEWAYNFLVHGGGITTEVNQPVAENSIPEAISLEQNYPNPFNHATSIGYYLPESSKVEIAVYNMSGQKIETLIRGFKSQGAHIFRWDASKLATGVYLYRIRAGNFADVKLAVLMK